MLLCFRLVETIAEQGEDMQGYVSELILTLESVVDTLDATASMASSMTTAAGAAGAAVPPSASASASATGGGTTDMFKSTPNLKDSTHSGSPRGLSSGGGACNKHDSSASDGAKTVENDGDSTTFGVDTLPAYSEAPSPVGGRLVPAFFVVLYSSFCSA